MMAHRLGSTGSRPGTVCRCQARPGARASGSQAECRAAARAAGPHRALPPAGSPAWQTPEGPPARARGPAVRASGRLSQRRSAVRVLTAVTAQDGSARTQVENHWVGVV
eukprot:750066-Hanusia_phi.AAC.1